VRHVDILPENINIPDGRLVLRTLQYCIDYEMKIANLMEIRFSTIRMEEQGIGFNEQVLILILAQEYYFSHITH
jgi:hypothetical protein